MDAKEIVNSQAFKTINKLIDDKVIELKSCFHYIKLHMEEESTFSYKIGTRVHEEGSAYEELPYSPAIIESIVRNGNEILALRKEISDLQAFKCRLLNDYDFTRGDDALQKEIFG